MTTIWELDFYSRPILDDNNKKLWEVLICESPTGIASPAKGLFQYAEYCPNSSVNSTWLSEAIQKAIDQAGKTPDRVRFFRQSMNNMIVKACTDVNLSAQPSRRTFGLSIWLKERMEKVYPAHPNYQAGSNPSIVFPTTPPQRLPDALEGQKWQFVSLPASAFDEMNEWSIDFGESFSLKNAGVLPDTQIPGLIIYSPRALAMAAWMSGLELAAVRFDREAAVKFDRASAPILVLETGVIDRWILTPLPTPALQEEAQQFEQAKQQAQDVHFIALQTDPKVEAFAGFWLLRDVKLI
jgi:RNA-binding protein Tab2/Atab2